jgi:flagellar hook-length control protein FliK
VVAKKAMVITPYGRIEVDLGRIPNGAPMQTSGQGFEFALQRAEAAAAPRETAREEPAARPEATAKKSAVASTRSEPGERDTEAEPVGHADPVATASEAAIAVAEADVNQVNRGAAPEGQIAEGKGKDAAAAPSHQSLALPDAPAVAAARQEFAALLAGGGAVAAGATARTTAPADGRAIVDGLQQAKSVLLRTSAATPGYRTLSPKNLEMLEQARDSVFKQILVKLDRTGGEMRVRLEPPDLGELDLHLKVDGSNLTLSIGTGRDDLTKMIADNLHELRQSLQQNGLQVTEAEVHTRQGAGDQRREEPQHRQQATAGDDDGQAAITSLHGKGYITAEGLDFWV